MKLAEAAPELEQCLTWGSLSLPRYQTSEIRCETVYVPMRDATRLATDVYLPPALPAPVVTIRTPYSRSMEMYGYASTFMSFARRGYVVVSQDCRGTGDSEPDHWDYSVFEAEDGYDLIEWITQQGWFGGFIGACGGSYVGQTQWPMATHRAMSAIAPHVSGLGIAVNTVHLHMFVNGYTRVVGKGSNKLTNVHYGEIERMVESETMATGLFNAPLHPVLPPSLVARYPQVEQMTRSQAPQWLWKQYSSLGSAARADFIRIATGSEHVGILDIENLSDLFGPRVAHDAHTLPSADPLDRVRRIQAPALLLTGWYDWGLNDTLATWECLRRAGTPHVAANSRLLITPQAHNSLGYHEGIDVHRELQVPPTLGHQAGVLLRWYESVREQRIDQWPCVIYYLMGAHEWRVANDWPVPAARLRKFYLAPDGDLAPEVPDGASAPDHYVYDPMSPTPTVGGSIVSYLYPPGSVDVSGVQKRPDVLVYTTAPLERDLDVVGPLRMVLFASSSAVDTDFAARLSDVFPDGRAIQLQNGVLRARYRDPEPALIEPGRVYSFEIDVWATANRFKAGHRLRLDISSADFPRYDRNSNLGGQPGASIPARQIVYHDREHPSHLQLWTL